MCRVEWLALYIPPIGTRERCRPPSEKRVVAHNPQRPTKSGNSQHRLHNRSFICNEWHRRRWYSHPLIYNKAFIHSRWHNRTYLYGRRRRQRCRRWYSYVILSNSRCEPSVPLRLRLALLLATQAEIKTPRRSVV